MLPPVVSVKHSL